MKLIVGLGNPGKMYEATRHNIGFLVLDRLVKTVQASLYKKSKWYRLYKTVYNGEEIICLYPLTFMNRSGIAVQDIALRFNINLPDIIVIYDDFNLPLGSIRIRPGGSSGGHNGLQSILDVMQTKDIPRVRLGIYNEVSFSQYIDAADFVLSPFEQNEIEKATTMIQEAHNATLSIVKEGIPKAMSSFNKVMNADKSTNITNSKES